MASFSHGECCLYQHKLTTDPRSFDSGACRRVGRGLLEKGAGPILCTLPRERTFNLESWPIYTYRSGLGLGD